MDLFDIDALSSKKVKLKKKALSFRIDAEVASSFQKACKELKVNQTEFISNAMRLFVLSAEAKKNENK